MSLSKLSDSEKEAYSKDRRGFVFETHQYTEDRMNIQADEFTRLEIQIAAVLFGFSTVFVKNFALSPSLALKILFVTAVGMLVVSFVMGLIVLDRRGSFWKHWLEIRAKRLDKWDAVLRKEITCEEALAFHEGTVPDKGILISMSPHWTWILQTITLGISIGAMLIMFVLIIFGVVAI